MNGGPQPIKFVPPDERSSETGRGPWFLSSKGAQIYPFDLRPHEVDIEDIAHSLSRLCRFNGHCRHFYSVAQHSVYVAVHLPLELSFLGLMHDATEAYCGDLVRPIKRAIPMFQEIEDRIWGAIAVRFNLPIKLPAAVKEADSRALQSERRDLLAAHPWPWTIDQCAGGETIQPYAQKIVPLRPGLAEEYFLNAFVNMRELHANLWNAQ